MHPTPVLQTLFRRAQARGFDVFGTFSIAAYNAQTPEVYHLPSDANTAVVLGNTRRLWPFFVESLCQRPHQIERSDPFDRWVEEELLEMTVDLQSDLQLRYAHSIGDGMIAIQLAAALAGLSWTSPSHLSIHPVYGPWVSWRAVIVLPSSLNDADESVSNSIESQRVLASPCSRCEAGCLPAFSRAVNMTTRIVQTEVRTHWRHWLAVRDACELGRDWRFCEEQLRYHYTGDKDILRKLVTNTL